MGLAIVILAAGKGTRMHSTLPKVLHQVGGKPLLQHVLETARNLKPEQIITVVGHGAEAVRKVIGDDYSQWVFQEEQLGTGHALAVALPEVRASQVLVLYGDVPMIRADTLRAVVSNIGPDDMNVLTVQLPDPHGYGRVIRNDEGLVIGIIEEKDATPQQRSIQECNSGILAADRGRMKALLDQLDNQNVQGEYYLTDTIALAQEQGLRVHAVTVTEEAEVLGVNNKTQLHTLERYYQQRMTHHLLAAGVTLKDRDRVDIRGPMPVTGRDNVIDVNCILEGDIELGDDVEIGPNCYLKNVRLGHHVHIHANSVLENVVVGDGCQVGPYARLRPGTVLSPKAKIGNFVETKNAKIGQGSKVNHLSYIGDTAMGDGVNVGAGTITCNYDGAYKHQTIIGDHVFIGSNSALVAPVEIGPDATIGAGSTITKPVAKGKLAVARSRQVIIDSWVRPKKGA